MSLQTFLVGGVAGRVIESAINGISWSRAFPFKVPFRPTYAVGAVVLGELAPMLKGTALPVRASIYALALGGVEYASCQVDRATGPASWDYNGSCVDFKHMAAWAVLAVATEDFL